MIDSCPTFETRPRDVSAPLRRSGLGFQSVTRICPAGAAPRSWPRHPDTRWSPPPGLSGLGQALTWGNVARYMAGDKSLDSLMTQVGKLQAQMPDLIESQASLRNSLNQYNAAVAGLPASYFQPTFIPNFGALILGATRAKLDHAIQDYATALYVLGQAANSMMTLGNELGNAGLGEEANTIRTLFTNIGRLQTQSTAQLGAQFAKYTIAAKDAFFARAKRINVGTTDYLNPKWWEALYTPAAGTTSQLTGFGRLGVEPVSIAFLVLSIVKLLVIVVGVVGVVVGAVKVVGLWTESSRKIAGSVLEHEKRQSAIQAAPDLTQAQKDVAKKEDSAIFNADMKAAKDGLDAAKPEGFLGLPKWSIWGALGIAALFAVMPIIRGFASRRARA